MLAIREMVQRHGLLDKVTITSSSREVLRAAQDLTPDISRGLVAEYAWLDPLNVSVWTVNEPALMRRLADFGVDSLITDFPGLATATLGNR
ncbi:putative Glycerophosphoryl diester phosphodiesterase [Pseudomonas syringae pv. maculicola]|uniref:Putative Glycerophosphoryl diester phosphodiesterase n=1 Tax=Pseudomonas syringae pv. maculicola TaxID=59511 RepID=A0A3M2U9E3_PSEYM|nr:putative Glycerophosphoryl diester phosphodiesterase [Pseudomonas syringae pv. maculicola]